jgi:hypothetical protein
MERIGLPPDISHQEIFSGLEVRLIAPEERGFWEHLMERHHYLGLPCMVGNALRYIALWQDHWLALLGWMAPALKCSPRDRWIGWNSVFQFQRLHLIANNCRFLILPYLKVPNLASRILAVNLRCLSRDWQAIYGYPIVLAETFVDAGRFHGTCYLAANWKPLGLTKGFGKSGSRYFRHDSPKQVLVFPLKPKAPKWLSAAELPSFLRRCPMQRCTLSSKQMEDLRDRLLTLRDCRRAKGMRHPLAAVLTIAVAAILAGAKSFAAIAEWATRLNQRELKRLRARFNLKTGRFEYPSEPTIRRTLQNSDVEAVELLLGNWLLNVAQDDAVAVDGKTVRGASRYGAKIHLLSAFLHNQAVTVNQVAVPKETNEIPMMKKLLAPLAITGKVVTADALHTHRETARYIVEEKYADYLFTVKDNQQTLIADIKLLDKNDFSPCAPNHRQGTRPPGDSDHAGIDRPQ